MEKRLTLILGGARSGKSDLAQTMARKRSGESVLFVATAQAWDEEMRTRIEVHRAGRDAHWSTIEVPREVARALQVVNARLVVVDCVTLWVSNILLGDNAEQMDREIAEFLECYRRGDWGCILVSNEVGMGIVPENKLGREYRDLLGQANRTFAEAADEVFLLIAGLPVEIKSRTRQDLL